MFFGISVGGRNSLIKLGFPCKLKASKSNSVPVKLGSEVFAMRWLSTNHAGLCHLRLWPSVGKPKVLGAVEFGNTRASSLGLCLHSVKHWYYVLQPLYTMVRNNVLNAEKCASHFSTDYTAAELLSTSIFRTIFGSYLVSSNAKHFIWVLLQKPKMKNILYFNGDLL